LPGLQRKRKGYAERNEAREEPNWQWRIERREVKKGSRENRITAREKRAAVYANGNIFVVRLPQGKRRDGWGKLIPN